MLISISSKYNISREYILAEDYKDANPTWRYLRRIKTRMITQYNDKDILAVFPDKEYKDQKAILLVKRNNDYYKGRKLRLMESNETIYMNDQAILLFDIE